MEFDFNDGETCEKCGSKLKLRTRLSGEKEGHRYWVCSKYPSCNFIKKYAEEGSSEPLKWHLEGGRFTKY
jgi:ssDNA-binding Zn-finger/Zn-ribbon topoisomerase 1